MKTVMIKVYEQQLRETKDPVDRALIKGKIARAERPKGAKANG